LSAAFAARIIRWELAVFVELLPEVQLALVGVLLPNCPEFLINVYGIWRAGGVVVSLSPMMVAEEIAGVLHATDCRMIVPLDVLASRVEQDGAPQRPLWLVSLQDRLEYWERLGYRWVRMTHGGWRSWSRGPEDSFARRLEQASPQPPDTPDDDVLDDPAYVLSTGGTTAAPKAVVLTDRNLVANAWQVAAWAGFPIGTETILAVLPFFHSFGRTTCVTSGVALAATLVMQPATRAAVFALAEAGRAYAISEDIALRVMRQ
jgi:long-chain acyl-CoA synthetase